MLKMNGIGKAFFGALGIAAVAKIVEGATSSHRSVEEEFSEDVLEAMVAAAQAGNYSRFAALYRRGRPYASDEDISSTYRNLLED
jgi:hypothetical protein